MVLSGSQSAKAGLAARSRPRITATPAVTTTRERNLMSYLPSSTIGTITSSPCRAGSLAANHVIFNRPFSCIYAFDVRTPVQAGDRFYASRPHGQQHDAEAIPAGLELLEHMGPVAPAEIDDAVAIALAVLKFVGELAADRGMQLYPDIGIKAREPVEIGLGRQGGDDIILEAAQDETCGKAVWPLPRCEPGRAALRDIEKDGVAAGAVDLLVEVGKLRGHAGVDLDDEDAVGCGVVHHLDIEQAVVEAESFHQGRCNLGHAHLHG